MAHEPKVNPRRAENLARERARRADREAAKLELMTTNRRERSKRSNTQQVKALDFRLGKGVGAARERAKLRERQAVSA